MASDTSETWEAPPTFELGEELPPVWPKPRPGDLPTAPIDLTAVDHLDANQVGAPGGWTPCTMLTGRPARDHGELDVRPAPDVGRC